jgi:hypothetical protein
LKIFTKIGLKAGYYLIRITPGDKWETASCMRYRHYEYLVIPFGLAIAPATFQDMMNEILHDPIDHGVVVYMDNILINTKNEEEYIRLNQEVPRLLQENNVAIAPTSGKKPSRAQDVHRRGAHRSLQTKPLEPRRSMALHMRIYDPWHSARTSWHNIP